MLCQDDIINFCNSQNYDVRVSGNGRWIDQKCTPDVLSVVADCIYNFVAKKPKKEFNTPDIWHFQYTIDNVQVIFKKPEVDSNAAKNEYDKFFQQPMELLAYSGILTKIKKGSRNFYQVANAEILEYLALREKNSLFFLKTYIEKVLNDSGLQGIFKDFFKQQTKSSYKIVKKSFSNFTTEHTKINGKVECNRIFSKVLNPLAFYNNSRGTEGGRLSKDKITLDVLMYNRNNFRDIYADKPKGVTRQEYAITHPVQVNDAYYKYQSTKAKNFLRVFNNLHRNSKTEHMEERHMEDFATNIHHIFPESEYREISAYLENLVAITPTQHFNYAHPNNNTSEIDEQYQRLLLLSKADRIHENLTSIEQEHIYEFKNLLFVLKVGFEDESVLNIPDMDFAQVVTAINRHYK